MIKRITVLVFLILFQAGVLRFYYLNWGLPYAFHPDENNMATAITRFWLPLPWQLPGCVWPALVKQKLTCNLNPDFFAYGQFPLYLAYFSGYLKHFFTQNPVNLLTLSEAIFWLRFWSATASLLTVWLIFLISRQIFNQKLALLTAFLAVFLPGFIQAAHFGTTESFLTLFYLLLSYLVLLYILKKIQVWPFVGFSAFTLGLALGTKVSSLLFFSLPVLVLIASKISLKQKIFSLFFLLFLSFLVFVAVSPVNFLAFNSFWRIFKYESEVALGSIQVFYTRQFWQTTPVWFQLTKIFPYVLGWSVFLLIFLSLLLLIFQFVSWFRQKNSLSKQTRVLIILLIAFINYFLPTAFLFVKWTRFMIPALSFLIIFAGYAFSQIMSLGKSLKDKNQPFFKNFLAMLLKKMVILTTLFSFWPGLFLLEVYQKDSRIQASNWIYQNIPENAFLLSETGNGFDLPLPLDQNNLNTTAKNYQLVSFDFYELDKKPELFEALLNHLEKADYIIIPSRRIFLNHLRLASDYPLTAQYYNLLFSGQLGFKQVAQITSPTRLQINNWNLALLDEQAEETWSVFDHPIVRIYQKQIQYNKKDYLFFFGLK